MKNAIRLYLQRGLSIFPTNPENKRPYFKWEQWADTKATGKQWNEWWKQHRGCNVSVIYSSSDVPEGQQLVCVDTDTPEAEAWVAAQAEAPATPTVKTRNGYHRYYLAPVGLKHYTGAADRPEVRCGRHYSQLPPSAHPSGMIYTWVEGLSLVDVPFAPLPRWGVELMERQQQEVKLPPAAAAPPKREDVSERARKYGIAALRNTAEALADARQGERNAALNTAAFNLGQLIASGCVTEPEIEQQLLAACQANGLLKDDGVKACEQTMRSGIRAGQADPRELPPMEDRRPHGIPQSPVVGNGGGSEEAAGEPETVPKSAVLSDIAGEMIEAFEEECRRDRVVRGLRTGFPSIDNHFCGFYRQQLIVVHGLSGYGKSHFSNHCIFSTALAEYEKGDDAALTIVFMLEGIKENLYSAYLGYRHGIPQRCREAGSEKHLTDEIRESLKIARYEFPLLPIAVYDDVVTLPSIEQHIKELAKERMVAGVVIDHAQLVEAPGCENPSHQGVNKVSVTLRNLSEQELHIPIMLLSQTTSDGKGNFNPQYGTALRNNSSVCFQIDRGTAGQKREDAVQSNIMRVANDKSRWNRVMAPVELRGNYETGRMYETTDYANIR